MAQPGVATGPLRQARSPSHENRGSSPLLATCRSSSPARVSPVTTTSHSGQGCPLVYTTAGTCCFPWHQHSLGKCDQRADSTRNATKFLNGIQPHNSHVWQPVCPFLTLFSLGSAAPAPGTQVPTAVRGEGPGTREPRSQRRMKDNVGLCRNPEARRWLRVNVRFWAGSRESCPAMPSITLLWLHVQKMDMAGMEDSTEFITASCPSPAPHQAQALLSDAAAQRGWKIGYRKVLRPVRSRGFRQPNPPTHKLAVHTNWSSASQHTGRGPRAVFSRQSPSSPRRRGCLNLARAC